MAEAVSPHQGTLRMRLLGDETVTWVDPDGDPWLVTVTFADLAGEVRAVGLAMASYAPTDDPDWVAPWFGIVTARNLRALRVGEVIEQAREQAAGSWLDRALESIVDGGQPDLDRHKADAAAIAESAQPTMGRPPDRDRGHDFLVDLAALVIQARAMPGAPSLRPWQWAVERLQADGRLRPGTTPGMIRNWKRRAQVAGLIPKEPRSKWKQKARERLKESGDE